MHFSNFELVWHLARVVNPFEFNLSLRPFERSHACELLSIYEYHMRILNEMLLYRLKCHGMVLISSQRFELSDSSMGAEMKGEWKGLLWITKVSEIAHIQKQISKMRIDSIPHTHKYHKHVPWKRSHLRIRIRIRAIVVICLELPDAYDDFWWNCIVALFNASRLLSFAAIKWTIEKMIVSVISRLIF